jgi:murein DD-endopeptidase MepM/ murein hydrolase activator NlpD
VVRAENAGGLGNAVFIYHPVARRISMYAHLSRMDVRVGEFTKQGEVVGLAGATGYATAAHLHFGVKNAKGAWVDPAEFLSQVADWQQVALANRTDLPQQTKPWPSESLLRTRLRRANTWRKLLPSLLPRHRRWWLRLRLPLSTPGCWPPWTSPNGCWRR